MEVKFYPIQRTMDSQNEVMDAMGKMWRMLDSLAENDPTVRTIAMPLK